MWQTVPGWLTREEGQKLQELALGRRVVELGSWKGRSTCALLETAALVVAVDWHQGDDGAGWEDTSHAFMGNVNRTANPANCIAIRGRIEQVGPLLASGCAELVYIDSAHDAEAVARDTALALRLVTPGGIIAWHDWNYESVRRGAAAGWQEAQRLPREHVVHLPAKLPTADQIVGSLAWTVVGPWRQDPTPREDPR